MGVEVFVAGVSMTRFGRFPLASVKDLGGAALRDALIDAGIVRTDLEGAYFGNALQGHMEGQHMVRGQIVLRGAGLERIPIVNVENACASGATAFCEAVKFLRAGEGEVVLALGAEKLFSSDRDQMFSAFNSGWDLATAEVNAERLSALGRDVVAPPGTMSCAPYSQFMDVYAAFGRHNMREYGLTQRQLAVIAAKNHNHAVYNERAQYRQPFTVEEILSAPPIAYPLTRPMCAPISDGAAAAILCTTAGLKRLGIDRNRAIRVLASITGSGANRGPGDYAEAHVARLAAERAYARAGVGPDDIQVAEVHDATAVGEAIITECVGFASPGGGGELADAGVTAIGGRLPINPSGGLESKGHPVGATGLGQIFELVSQLRGECGPRQVEGARIALAENGGGLWGYDEAVCAITILAK